MSLDDIGRHYGTDKSSEHHNYLAIYEQQIPRSPHGSLLELGWLDGASVQTWRDWLPDGWTITGLDIALKESLPGINFVHGSQDDPGAIAAAARYAPFDVIIDDASHEVIRTRLSFRLLWPYVKPGGRYFIEDLSTTLLSHWGGDERGDAFYGLLATLVGGRAENIHQISFWHNLCMIQKGV